MGIDKVLENEGMTNVAEKEQQTQEESGQQQTEQTNEQTNEQTSSQEAGGQEGQSGETGQQTEQTNQTEGESGQQTQEQQTEGNEQGQGQEIDQQTILKHLNEQLGGNFKSLDDIKNLQEAQKSVEDYKTKLQEKDEALQSVGDPMKQFANENVAKANEILKNNENLSFGIAAKLATADVDNMSDDDALMYDQLIQNPHYEGRENMLRKMVNKSYKTEASGDEEELSDEDKEEIEIQKFKKEADARKAKERLKQMANVETPQAKNVEEEYKQNKQQKIEQFKPHADTIKQELDSVKVGKNGYEFKVSDDFKNFLDQNDNLTQFLANNFDPNDPNSKQKAVDSLKELYKKQNLDKIVDDIEEQVAARIRDEFHQQSHNPKTNNRQEKPEFFQVNINEY